MKKNLALALLCFCLIAAAAPAFAINLYPVQGPAATLAEPPPFTGKLTGSKVILSQAGGESFQGKYKLVMMSFAYDKGPGSPASFPPQPNLAYAWDAVYGQGYFVAKLLGLRIEQAVLTGDRGSILQVEFLNQGKAVAVDSKGNIYKVVW
jgi:hypothetical protein